jgi:uncharacterized protein (DUF305 family)
MLNRTASNMAVVFIAAALSAGCFSARAQEPASMPGMSMPSSTSDTSGSTQAFHNADEKMMKGMETPPYSGDADKDFVAHMIPHHQGAVDMAKVELKYGKDPELKRLAAKIIKAQDDEIRFMQTWLAKHGGE